MSENQSNPLMQIGGKVIGPVAKLLGLEAKLERLIDRVNALREDQIALQKIAFDINARSISNRDMTVDHKQQSDRAYDQTNSSIADLKQENITLRREVGELKELVTELRHQIEMDAKTRELEFFRIKDSLRQEFRASSQHPAYKNNCGTNIDIPAEKLLSNGIREGDLPS